MNFSTEITTQEISPQQLLQKFASTKSGANVVFYGIIRDEGNGKLVDHLFYEAHEILAENLVNDILQEANKKFKLEFSLAVHRIGKLIPGEIAVGVLTWSKHRKEAYDANEYIIHRIKHEAPIWKKEIFTDGTYVWGNNCHC